ncbi:23S rRNA (adenine(1618)-N(6))-methyltransferase RlmF [Sphingobacterium sp. Mn56C]|uniref:23S rRNA (adenine(1618)-N(6))-methyltransferase RlmF n=1 Tax=Sphingobacterium sp. Mn56C TaxID=3395261 RepID=UPI003BE67F1D
MINSNPAPAKLHGRNKHLQGYDLKRLEKANPNLKAFTFVNDFGKETIDFADPKAVFELNKGLLKADYKLKFWEIAPNSLCPAIPGRADYMHYIADLLAQDNNGQIPYGKKISVLDIGTGSNLVYPIIGAQEYEWNFVGTDIDANSIHFAEVNIARNIWLKKKIQVRLQTDRSKIFSQIIQPNEKYSVVVCNPPFYKSREDNWKSSTKKFQTLNKNKDKATVQNFAGHPNELWCEGGEQAFISKMIYESKDFQQQLGWVTTLVASKEHLKPLIAILEYHKAARIEIIPMQQGQKISRILAWKWQ